MSHRASRVDEPCGPATYRVSVKGRLPGSLVDELDGFTVHADGSTSTLTGPLADPAQLYGLIARMESLGLTLLSLDAMPPNVNSTRVANVTTKPDSGARRTPMTTVSEHTRLLLAAHQAMRADGQRLRSAVAVLPGRQPGVAVTLSRAFGTLVSLIHDHHRAEDDVMYPFLVERVATFERDAARLERDHVHLAATMTRISAGLRLLTRPASPVIEQDARHHVVDDAHAFNDILDDHLDREEAVVVPLFESMLSEGDQRLLAKAQTKLTTYRHVRLAVPWVLANASTEEAVELRRLAPRLVGIAHDHLWRRRFHHLMAPLYDPATAA